MENDEINLKNKKSFVTPNKSFYSAILKQLNKTTVKPPKTDFFFQNIEFFKCVKSTNIQILNAIIDTYIKNDTVISITELLKSLIHKINRLLTKRQNTEYLSMLLDSYSIILLEFNAILQENKNIMSPSDFELLFNEPFAPPNTPEQAIDVCRSNTVSPETITQKKNCCGIT